MHVLKLFHFISSRWLLVRRVWCVSSDNRSNISWRSHHPSVLCNTYTLLIYAVLIVEKYFWKYLSYKPLFCKCAAPFIDLTPPTVVASTSSDLSLGTQNLWVASPLLLRSWVTQLPRNVEPHVGRHMLDSWVYFYAEANIQLSGNGRGLLRCPVSLSLQGKLICWSLLSWCREDSSSHWPPSSVVLPCFLWAISKTL